MDPDLVRAFASTFIKNYSYGEDSQEWFGQVRSTAGEHGFAPSPKEFKKNPEAYPGSIREASQLVRVALTGSTRSPDLHAVAGALGTDEVLRRLSALTA